MIVYACKNLNEDEKLTRAVRNLFVTGLLIDLMLNLMNVTKVVHV